MDLTEKQLKKILFVITSSIVFIIYIPLQSIVSLLLSPIYLFRVFYNRVFKNLTYCGDMGLLTSMIDGIEEIIDNLVYGKNRINYLSAKD